nr:hypothetical protein HK105_004143 [Polyrhizophydium stewartii]
MSLPVQWGDMDSFGHVNNVKYARFFESGRLYHFEQILRPHLSAETYRSFITGRGIGPIVKSFSINFRAPCWYNDILTVAVRGDNLKRDRFTQRFVLVSHAQERVVADGDAVIVIYDYQKGAKTDIPPELLRAYEIGEREALRNAKEA